MNCVHTRAHECRNSDPCVHVSRLRYSLPLVRAEMRHSAPANIATVREKMSAVNQEYVAQVCLAVISTHMCVRMCQREEIFTRKRFSAVKHTRTKCVSCKIGVVSSPQHTSRHHWVSCVDEDTKQSISVTLSSPIILRNVRRTQSWQASPACGEHPLRISRPIPSA